MPSELATTRSGTGRRLVFVHGFTQSGRAWDPMTAALGAGYEIIAVDAPGHAGSDAVRADLPTGAGLLGATGGRATYIGYSMGGRLALHLALARPDLVEALVLIGTDPGIVDDGQRALRRRADEDLAAAIERDGVEAFLDRWLAQPLFDTLPASAADRGDRARNTAAGLAASLRLAGTGTQEPLWDRLPELAMPVLVVAGARDTKFAAVARHTADVIPGASLAIVPDAGHSVPLEQPHLLAGLLARWLASQPPSASPAAATTP